MEIFLTVMFSKYVLCNVLKSVAFFFLEMSTFDLVAYGDIIVTQC